MLEQLKNYSSKSFFCDLIAGLTVGTILIPQSLAYASICELPPIYGLYSCLVPIFIYTLFASSRQLHVGPVALSSILIMVGITKNFPEASGEYYIGLVIFSTLLIGIFQLCFSLFNLGFITRYISRPVIYGFVSAAALIIIGSQLKDLLGIYNIEKGSDFISYFSIFKSINLLNQSTLLIGILSISFLWLCKFKLKKVPAPLIIVSLGIIISYWINLESSYDVKLIGKIPSSLPSFIIPTASWTDIFNLSSICLVIAILGVAESVGMAKNLDINSSEKPLNVKQEIFAHGLSKVVGSFFQSIPISASYSRTAINQNYSAKSQISSVVSVGLVLISIFFLTEILALLPKVILASIILASVIGLIEYKQLKKLYYTNRGDLTIMLITFFATLSLGITTGLFVGVICSLLLVLYKSGNPQIKVLGKIPGTQYFKDIKVRNDAKLDEKVLIVRLDDQLYFGNADYFIEHVLDLIEKTTTPPTHVIFAMKNVHDLDTTGAEAIKKLQNILNHKNISLIFAEAIYAVRNQMMKCDLMAKDEAYFMNTFDAYNSLKTLP